VSIDQRDYSSSTVSEVLPGCPICYNPHSIKLVDFAIKLNGGSGLEIAPTYHCAACSKLFVKRAAKVETFLSSNNLTNVSIGQIVDQVFTSSHIQAHANSIENTILNNPGRLSLMVNKVQDITVVERSVQNKLENFKVEVQQMIETKAKDILANLRERVTNFQLM